MTIDNRPRIDIMKLTHEVNWMVGTINWTLNTKIRELKKYVR